MFQARSAYRYAIKKAKQEHWDQFLANAIGKDVFTALKLAKPQFSQKSPDIRFDKNGVKKSAKGFEEKCDTFLRTLFDTDSITPPRPPQSLGLGLEEPRVIPLGLKALNTPQNPTSSGSKAYKWDWPSVAPSEVETAIRSASPSSAPGPDTINYRVIQLAYRIAPDAFYKTYDILFRVGYHPKAWRESLGIVLPKRDKPDYSVPKAYRIIALLNCLGKILEKLFATRLNYLANLDGSDLYTPRK